MDPRDVRDDGCGGDARATYEPPFKSWVRLNEGRPILSPRGTGFEAAGTFDPAVRLGQLSIRHVVSGAGFKRNITPWICQRYGRRDVHARRRTSAVAGAPTMSAAVTWRTCT